MQLCRQVSHPCSRDTGHEFKIWFRVSLLPQSLHLSVPLLPQFFKLLRVGRKSTDARTAKLRTPLGRLKISDLQVRAQDWRSGTLKDYLVEEEDWCILANTFYCYQRLSMFLISDLVLCHDLLSDFLTAADRQSAFMAAYLMWSDMILMIHQWQRIYSALIFWKGAI